MIHVVHYYIFDTYLTHASCFTFIKLLKSITSNLYILVQLRYLTSHFHIQKKSRHVYVTSNEIQRDIGNLRPGREFITLYKYYYNSVFLIIGDYMGIKIFFEDVYLLLFIYFDIQYFFT